MAYQEVKEKLREECGCRCFLCGRKLKKKECTYHHILLKSRGGQATIDNGALLDETCHRHVHKYNFDSTEYARLNNQIKANKHLFKQEKARGY